MKNDSRPPGTSRPGPANRAFSLVEVLMVVTLLSLIILVLMAVFNSTQSAFRSGVTQDNVLESTEAAMGLMASDLKLLIPSRTSVPTAYLFLNNRALFPQSPSGVNFFANSNLDYVQPLVQSLVGSGQQRTNVLQNFYMLSRANLQGRDMWVGTGYTVSATNASPLYPLYRFSAALPTTYSPEILFSNYLSGVATGAFTNAAWSHLVDGVVDLRVRAYDMDGTWLTNGYTPAQMNNITVRNTVFLTPSLGEMGILFFSNAVPATVELQVGVLEDRVLVHAESLPGPQSGSLIQSNYLSQQAGRVHIFRQRVAISGLDSTAYTP
jgi:type II secretory pathway component PulJ